MSNSKDHLPTMYERIPAVAALNKVPGFDPVKLLRRTVSPKTKEEVLQLDLPYKKLWFRLANPKGRIRLNALRITEQLAIYEALVYLDRSDAEPIGSFTSCRTKEDTPDGQYIQAAQKEAMNEALSDAGYGLQFADVSMDSSEKQFGSRISLSGQSDGAGNMQAQELPKQDMVAPAKSPKSEESKPQVSKPQTVRPQAARQQVLKTSAPAIVKASEPEELPVKAGDVEDLPVSAETVQQTIHFKEEDALPVAPPNDSKALPAENAGMSAGAEENQKTPVTEKQPQSDTQTAMQILQSGAGTEATSSQTEAETPAKYTQDMPVEKIMELMTFDEAQNVVVDVGICHGWTIGQVAEKRPASLKFYVYGGYQGKNNILRAAARITLDALTAKKAG